MIYFILYKRSKFFFNEQCGACFTFSDSTNQ